MTVVALLLAACGGGPDVAPDPTMIAAAESLRAVMPDLVDAYVATHPGATFEVTTGASGSLRQQVEAGAPVDVVVFAASAPVGQLVEAGLVDPTTRAVVATNELVLVGPRGGAGGFTFANLSTTLPVGDRVAIGEPGAVPAGKYAVEAFTALGTWEALSPHVVYAGDVGACLQYARRGEVAAAVVYATDARSAEDVVVFERAVGAWAPRAEVVAARTTHGAQDPHATAFLEFLSSEPARLLFTTYGFGNPMERPDFVEPPPEGRVEPPAAPPEDAPARPEDPVLSRP